MKISEYDEEQLIAKLVTITLDLRGQKGKDNISAYLINMGVRLIRLKRVLKNTGSIYLHCDPTASHYLKMLMDAMFGHKNFLGEIIWNKGNGVKSKTKWGNENDTILCYAKNIKKHMFNSDDPKCRIPYSETSLEMHFQKQDSDGRHYRERIVNGKSYIYYADEGRFIGNLWNDTPSMQANTPLNSESLGFPTQKPLELMERIIKASSNKGDLVLDPFCGCGTTLHAAEALERRWIGIDISRFSASLVKSRILANNDDYNTDLKPNDITVEGMPTSPEEARALAQESEGNTGPLEFEKWVCGVLGTSSVRQKKSGKGGPDGGVDGLLKFFPFRMEVLDSAKNREHEEALAVIQVKSGRLQPNDVKALPQVIENTPGAMAAVIVAFERWKTTFDNWANTDLIEGINGEYRKVQFLSVEELFELSPNPDFLPNIHKSGGKIENTRMPKTEAPADPKEQLL